MSPSLEENERWWLGHFPISASLSLFALLFMEIGKRPYFARKGLSRISSVERFRPSPINKGS